MGIKISHITKRFGRFTALEDVSLDIQVGELVALLGPSGSGKTTLLRIIAGLEIPDSGRVFLSGEDRADRKPNDRLVGFVFQHYALFRHMTVYNNIAFGLNVLPRKERPSRAAIRDKVFSLLKLVQLEHFSDFYPAQLSGGQRQRVALARALAVEPKVLLLDEPFGALDAKVRKELRRWLRRLHEEIHVTTVFVTHDQEEALEVADRLVIMNHGAIEQIGTPEDVYHHPANAFVFNFLGDVNLFRCRSENGYPRIIGHASFEHFQESEEKQAERAFVRPHLMDISLLSAGANEIEGTIAHINPAGPTVKIEILSKWGEIVHAHISQEKYAELQLQSGMHVFLIPKQIQIYSS
ncbi:sulfate ABC transporter ATP-binding protein [candidate division KSB1 bacterium]|nr:sulfate ABC transporter ATP-binding protein [candidate division KSB1 bacterium]RQW06274.1 MAG: sulfate ABC transporter ATP-binding protein [candidate division KSB1 bacterium]